MELLYSIFNHYVRGLGPHYMRVRQNRSCYLTICETFDELEIQTRTSHHGPSADCPHVENKVEKDWLS